MPLGNGCQRVEPAQAQSAWKGDALAILKLTTALTISCLCMLPESLTRRMLAAVEGLTIELHI